MKNRPDQSFYLAHFTKDSDPCSNVISDNIKQLTQNKTALEKLQSILDSKTIYASSLPWVNREGVCLTECPWTSLLEHSKKYSPYGVGFNKAFVFGTGGGPVYYVRHDHWSKQQWSDHLKTFVTPFWPKYRTGKQKNFPFPTVDFTHEREWRVPHTLTFDYDDIEFVVLKNYNDMAQFPTALKDSIGRERFILMDNYKLTEKLWPVHNIEM
jgi:hypothetical protein